MSASPSGPLLVIDSASRRGLVAVVEAGTVLAEHAWDLGTTFSRELLTAIDPVLDRSSRARTDLAGIAVVTGPGGYGSLRAGVATAQGLALALDVPLAGVHRLELDAAPHLEAGPVVAVHDAGRSGLAWAAYERAEGGAPPRVLVEPRIDEAAACAASAPRGALWCGELTEDLREAWQHAGTDAREAEAAPPASRALGAVALADAHDAFGDPAGVDVVYLRPPSITRPRS
ncbi:MAG: tRNA (adenosine(37)-N6)-threonylcarbamoyltransferase complex dimerization subunit type 1 TsaB [Dehalococcoidia bacterium]